MWQGRRAWICGMLVSFGIVASGVAPRPAVAAVSGGAPPAAAAIEQARQAEAAGHLDEAVARLEWAYELNGDPELLFRLGELTSRLGQNLRALRLYRTYLTRSPAGENHAIAELRIAALEQPVPPSGAGGAVPGQPASPPAASRAPAPFSPAPLAPSSAASAAATAPPAAETTAAATIAVAPSSGPPVPRWVPWAGLAATVVLAVAATVSGLSATDRYDQLHSSCGATAAGCSQGQIDDVRSSAQRTTILWVGAGVLAAATGAGFYVNTREAGVSGVWRF